MSTDLRYIIALKMKLYQEKQFSTYYEIPFNTLSAFYCTVNNVHTVTNEHSKSAWKKCTFFDTNIKMKNYKWK